MPHRLSVESVAPRGKSPRVGGKTKYSHSGGVVEGVSSSVWCAARKLRQVEVRMRCVWNWPEFWISSADRKPRELSSNRRRFGFQKNGRLFSNVFSSWWEYEGSFTLVTRRRYPRGIRVELCGVTRTLHRGKTLVLHHSVIAPVGISRGDDAEYTARHVRWTCLPWRFSLSVKAGKFGAKAHEFS